VDSLEEVVGNLLQIQPVSQPVRNFALHRNGAIVIPELTSTTHNLPQHTIHSWILQQLRGFDTFHEYVNLPYVVLEDDVSVGQCWEFAGSTGTIGIRLPEAIQLSEVIIRHIQPAMVSPGTLGQAPRDVVLWGRIGSNQMKSLDGYEGYIRSAAEMSFPRFSAHYRTDDQFLRLSLMRYDVSALTTIQKFSLSHEISALGLFFQILVFEVRSNWGSPTTCLYHFGIHGIPSL
jgi:hypothetical protein